MTMRLRAGNGEKSALTRVAIRSARSGLTKSKKLANDSDYTSAMLSAIKSGRESRCGRNAILRARTCPRARVIPENMSLSQGGSPLLAQVTPSHKHEVLSRLVYGISIVNGSTFSRAEC